MRDEANSGEAQIGRDPAGESRHAIITRAYLSLGIMAGRLLGMGVSLEDVEYFADRVLKALDLRHSEGGVP